MYTSKSWVICCPLSIAVSGFSYTYPAHDAFGFGTEILQLETFVLTRFRVYGVIQNLVYSNDPANKINRSFLMHKKSDRFLSVA
jgi:hypothetical protein